MKDNIKACIFVIAFIIVAVFACIIVSIRDGNTDAGIGTDSWILTVVSPHPTAFIVPLIHEFENETGIEVNVISCGTTEAIERITGGDSIDVLWGGSLLSVGPYKDYFYSYESPESASYKDEFKNTDLQFSCFSDVPSVIIINTDIIGDINITGYEDLLDDRLKGQIAFASPKASSSSFEHLVNILYAMGEGNPDNGWDYVQKLTEQIDGKLLESSYEVYNGVANGSFKVGLTFEEAAVTMLKSDKHIGIIYMNEGVVSTPDGIYINNNSKHLSNAGKFVDFMTSYDTQLYMAGELGRRSVRSDVEASKLLRPYDEIYSIEVDKQRVIGSKSEWTDSFMTLYGEQNNE